MRGTLGDSALFMLSILVPGAISMVVLPFTTRILGPTEYGLVELCFAIGVVTTCLATLELPQGLARFLPEARTPERRGEIGSTTLTSCTFGLLLAAPFIMLASYLPQFSRLVPNDPLLRPAFCAALVCTGMQSVAVRHLRWSFRPISYLSATVIASAITAALTMVGLGYGRRLASSVLLAQAAGSLISLLVSVALARGELRPAWYRPTFTRLSAFSVPLVLSTLASMASSQAGRILVAEQIGLAQAAHFGLALRLAGILGLATTALQMATTPAIYARHDHADLPVWLASGARLVLFTGLSLWIAVAELSSLAVRLIGGMEFSPSAPLVPILCATLLVSCLGTFFPGLELMLRTRTAALIAVGSGAFSLGALVLLLPMGGLLAAATAPLVACILQLVLTIRASQQILPAPHHWGRLLAACVIAGSAVSFVFIAPKSPTVLIMRLALDAVLILFLAWLLKAGEALANWRAGMSAAQGDALP